MWLFTTEGFFSATMSKVEPEKIQLRARNKKDLKRFLKKQGLKLPILLTPERDYGYRVILAKEQFGKYMQEYIAEMTYSNFKDEVWNADTAENCSRKEKEMRHGVYFNVWREMLNYQVALKQE